MKNTKEADDTQKSEDKLESRLAVFWNYSKDER